MMIAVGWPLKMMTETQEIKPTMIDAMDVRLTFVRAEIQDGDIICIQKHISEEK
jgi:ubiquitin carboxyl-terminal hydrolase 7